jgi:hypothetical protein
MAIPTKDSALVAWSNADTRLTASPVTYGITAPVATQYKTLHDAFLATYAWRFECSTSRTTFQVQFDAGAAPGTTVWLTALWLNRRGEPGPACAPIAARVPFAQPMPSPRRLAA